MKRPLVARWLLAFFVTVTGLTVALPTRATAQAEQCFPQTGQCVHGRFLDYWLANGGLAINGYPIAPERREILEDGKEYTVQYFERTRLELHPENAAPYDVLLGQFGRQIVRETAGVNRYEYEAAIAPVAAAPGKVFFAETGHNVGGRFLAYWQANGGLAQFGLPLTEEREERLLVGTEFRPFQVQYFERARFEYHPENAAPYDVLLGQFGREINTWAQSLREPFATLYRTTPQVRDQIGVPAIDNLRGQTEPIVSTRPGTFLAFERGAMIFTAGEGGVPGRIQVLCGDSGSGTAIIGPRLVLGLPDTWTPDQPEGGAPGPRPGTYEPKRGFGKVWPLYRDCLGYATSENETGYTQTAQYFSRGFLVTLPESGAIYALYTEATAPGQTTGRYQRYTLP